VLPPCQAVSQEMRPKNYTASLCVLANRFMAVQQWHVWLAAMFFALQFELTS
jgi:hypothetical protein